jgi:hypothetical protein
MTERQDFYVYALFDQSDKRLSFGTLAKASARWLPAGWPTWHKARERTLRTFAQRRKTKPTG